MAVFQIIISGEVFKVIPLSKKGIGRICPKCGNKKDYSAILCKECRYPIRPIENGGLCACGCGGKVTVRCRKSRRFISGHNSKEENHSQWKGGKVKSGEGRLMIMTKGHPRANKAGYVFEHILMVEKAFGKYIPVGVVVHHVDGNHEHNENNNFVLCENESYHQVIEARTRAFKSCGHANWRKCYRCHEWDSPSNMKIYSNRAVHLKKCGFKDGANLSRGR